MDIQEKNKKIYQELLKGKFGIEKESIRVDEEGQLAKTEHPPVSMDSISRDFGESQVEFISDAWENLFDACHQICGLQKIVEDCIALRDSGREYIWDYSNPPGFYGEDDIRIAEFLGEKQDKTNYREYLSQKYGKVKMLYSGVHFNYSVSDTFVEELQNRMGISDKKQVKSEWYLNLSNRLMNDSWLLVALTAASPVAEEDFLCAIGVAKEDYHAYASFRNSIYGYWNQFEPELSYGSFEEYCDSVDSYIQDEKICSIQELYYPIRLKPAGENSLEELREKGVNHMELRMLDLNPFACSGVEKKDLVFIHLLISFRMHEMLAGKDTSMEFATDAERIQIHKKAARLDFLNAYPRYMEYGLDLLNRLEAFYHSFESQGQGFVPKDYDVDGVLSFQREKLYNEKHRYAVFFGEKYNEDFIESRMKEIREKI